MLHLQAHVGYELSRLERAERERTAARRYLGHVARELNRRDSPPQREVLPRVVRFPWRRRIVDQPRPAAV